MDTSASCDKGRATGRGVRPLAWWLILVLILYGHRTHQRLMEQTRLNFSVSMQGRPLDGTVTLDGHSVFSGEKISLGSHRLMVTHPKASAFSTNFFVWYGEHDLGDLALTRARGVLKVAASPPAQSLTIRGPEFSVILTNTSGLTSAVPTDQYVVEALYEHWQKREEVPVMDGLTAVQAFAPKFGALRLEASHGDVTYELRNGNRERLSVGSLPATITELPEGKYQVSARRNDDERDWVVTVTAWATNAAKMEFMYGAANLESDPPGATVTSGGKEYGVTPLTLPELKPGQFEFSLALSDYETLTGSVAVATHATNQFHGTLVSRHYTLALESARRYYANEDYGRAAESATEALKYKPDDVEAMKIVADYAAREQQRIEAQRKQREAEMAQQQRQQRINHLNEVFEAVSQTYENAHMFGNFEFKATNRLGAVASAINQAMLTTQPAFVVVKFDWPQPDTFTLQVRQRVGIGRRECLIVGVQVGEDETQVRFKVVEYEQPAPIKILGGVITLTPRITIASQDSNAIRAKEEQMHVRVVEGTKLVGERIKKAVGVTPVMLR